MDNKKDWEELEKWNEERKKNNKVNYYELNINIDKQNKKVDKVVKVLKITGWISKLLAGIIFIIIIFFVIIIFDMLFSNIKSRTNVEVVETIENMYNIKVEVISKEIDEKKNGKYILRMIENNDIQFYAIKKYGSLTEDFSDRCHKYYFEKWNNKEKSDFKVISTITNDILHYETYIENYENLEDSTNEIVDFAEFCENNFYASWKIYLKKADMRIYPYQGNNITRTEALNNANKSEDEYLKYSN